MKARWVVASIAIAIAVAAVLLVIPFSCDHLQGNHQIRFLGRVVDQDGKGVPGVHITAKVTARERSHVPVPWGRTGNIYKQYAVTTDRDGSFLIESNGIDLVIGTFAKDGYRKPWEGDKQFPYRFDFDKGTPKPEPTDDIAYVMRKR